MQTAGCRLGSAGFRTRFEVNGRSHLGWELLQLGPQRPYSSSTLPSLKDIHRMIAVRYRMVAARTSGLFSLSLPHWIHL